jgi:hypothetical protein
MWKAGALSEREVISKADAQQQVHGLSAANMQEAILAAIVSDQVGKSRKLQDKPHQGRGGGQVW